MDTDHKWLLAEKIAKQRNGGQVRTAARSTTDKLLEDKLKGWKRRESAEYNWSQWLEMVGWIGQTNLMDVYTQCKYLNSGVEIEFLAVMRKLITEQVSGVRHRNWKEDTWVWQDWVVEKGKSDGVLTADEIGVISEMLAATLVVPNEPAGEKIVRLARWLAPVYDAMAGDDDDIWNGILSRIQDPGRRQVFFKWGWGLEDLKAAMARRSGDMLLIDVGQTDEIETRRARHLGNGFLTLDRRFFCPVDTIAGGGWEDMLTQLPQDTVVGLAICRFDTDQLGREFWLELPVYGVSPGHSEGPEYMKIGREDWPVRVYLSDLA